MERLDSRAVVTTGCRATTRGAPWSGFIAVCHSRLERGPL